jgi:hypothetical protein
MKAAMPLKYNTMDKEDIRVKLEQIKQSNQNKEFKPTMIGWRNYLQGVSWRILSKKRGSFPSCALRLENFV